MHTYSIKKEFLYKQISVNNSTFTLYKSLSQGELEFLYKLIGPTFIKKTKKIEVIKEDDTLRK